MDARKANARFAAVVPEPQPAQLAPAGTAARVATKRGEIDEGAAVIGRDRTSAPLVLRADSDAIAVLTLNRPQARNSLSEALIAAPADQLTAIAAECWAQN